MKQVAIVVLTWNALPLLQRYLPSLIEHTPKDLADIIIADNGSNDASISFAKNLGVEVLELGTNYGFAKGYNEAIKQLKHEYILILNNDVRVTKGWLEPLVSFLEESPETVSVQPKVRWDRAPQMYEYAGAEGGYLDYLGYPFCRGRVFNTLEEDKGQYGDEPKEVFWTTGAAMLVRRKAYIEAGGFDELFFAHQEEIDLAWRWQCMGYKLYVVPNSIVYHYGGASLKAGKPQKTFLNFRNNLLMLKKNLPDNKRWRVLIIRFFLDVLASFVFLVQGKPGESWAVIKARCSVLRMSIKRQEVGRSRGYNQLFHKSLLVRYHLLNKKIFSELL